MLNPLLVTTPFVTLKGGELNDIPYSAVSFEHTRLHKKQLKIGTEVMRCRLPSYVDDEVEVAGYAAPDIRLPQGRYQLIVGVDQMKRAVGLVLDRFAKRHGV